MAKDRPWNRAEYTEFSAPEDFDIAEAGDEEVRVYCLQRSRAFLARAETTKAVISSDRRLEIAAQNAMITHAFRPGPTSD
ncbi:hypothetical protein [Streptomyces tailanensis]|uniref:hypothetical protein n=1 Tax=Streptomyces tailanensis TaxID=2569858 RepID=UPI00122E7CE9|nr:hypothetical protein [Streptomyces tailanensis]